MNEFLKVDPWNIVEEGFSEENHRAAESIFSLGNGRFGQRANFEEKYSGDTLQGNYIAGVYYPDKTRVGWWKNGYPEYFAKVLNAPNWIGLNIKIDGEEIDLAQNKIISFRRTLNMREGLLHRNYHIMLPSGKQVKADVKRFLSIANPEIGAIRYNLVPVNFSGRIEVTSYLDAGIKNADSNYDEYFWDEVDRDLHENTGFITVRTRKTEYHVTTGVTTIITAPQSSDISQPKMVDRQKYISSTFNVEASEGSQIIINKYAVVVSSLYHATDELRGKAASILKYASETGFEKLLNAHISLWADKWNHSDIVIEGDHQSQQAIRFNIFQLNQTYTGEDERLNIGPKGFTGEKYGGSTYWDTEAFCFPFFLCTAPQHVARNLLRYRYRHLSKAIENGAKLGFSNGAALYPMVTMNGEECHNEWEITFEEIHRNGTIAYAIFNYVKHTGDMQYLVDYGLEVLIALSRFWKQRVNFSRVRGKFVILGVTGPNEYENNVNNNWYTNTIAAWTLNYTLDVIQYIRKFHTRKFKTLSDRIHFDEVHEISDWKHIAENIYFPYDEELGIMLQQDGYLEKEQMTADELDPAQRPINQHWSWDRILRSCFIKQADVLQGLYFFEEKYPTEVIKRNFDFYEPRTLHESSLSSCIHAVLAAHIGDIEKAYQLYLRASRLDLDDYNNEVKEGLHITSMAGTWISVVEGFAGKRVKNDKLVLNPALPEKWKSYSFRIVFRGSLLRVKVTASATEVINESDIPTTVSVYGKDLIISGHSKKSIEKEHVEI